jgi:elongator complex protein 1
MSSCQLSLSSSALLSSPDGSRTPIHASFSAMSDTLAVLWESGYVELWSLRTWLEGGRGKAMDPSRLWSGFVDSSPINSRKQILLSSSDATGASSTLVVLSSGQENDVVTIVELDSYATVRSSSNVNLSHRNCRLVTTHEQVVCQVPTGDILRCLFSKV